MVRGCWAGLVLVLAACDGELPWESSSKDKDKTVDPCDPLPTNGTPATAEPMAVDTETVGKFCKGLGPAQGWFKAEGQFDPGDRLRLKVVFDRGLDAEDIDFDVGTPSGGGVGGATVYSGSCRNAAGQEEDCRVTLTNTAPLTEIYVLATPGALAEREVFRIYLTREGSADAAPQP
jgi:hypothetical protein